MSRPFPLLAEAEVLCLRDGYCNFCGTETEALVPTHDRKAMCLACADKLRFCEICGSYREEDQDVDEQLHYEEDCFK